jgi:hypothetical protein
MFKEKSQLLTIQRLPQFGFGYWTPKPSIFGHQTPKTVQIFDRQVVLIGGFNFFYLQLSS